MARKTYLTWFRPMLSTELNSLNYNPTARNEPISDAELKNLQKVSEVCGSVRLIFQYYLALKFEMMEMQKNVINKKVKTISTKL